jgi:transposase-like protein
MNKRKAKSYTLEFKQSSAKLAATSEQPISQTAKDLGVKASTLHGWVNMYHPKTTIKEVAGNNLEEEVKKLRKENARLRQEREILKKAAAYFASEIS